MNDVPEPLREVVGAAIEEAQRAKATAVTPIHLAIALCALAPPAVVAALRSLGKDPAQIARRARAIAKEDEEEGGGHGRLRVSTRFLVVLATAKQDADTRGRELDEACLLAAVLRRPDRAVRRLVEAAELPAAALRDRLFEQPEAADPSPARSTRSAPKPRGDAHPATPTLDKYGKDYTALARAGRLDPMVGRKAEVKQVVRVLLRKQKSNPVLVGEPGVGKTSVVEELARVASADDAPAAIAGFRIVEIVLSALLAGTKHRGDFEERLERILSEAGADPELVVFFDEIHMLVGAGGGQGATDAANLLKPALARGTIRCIGATTPEEYRKHIEKDPALERRFQPVRVEEPSPEEARAMLDGIVGALSRHHGVAIAPDALDAAIELSVRYLPDRRLPDKARDLVDQAAANRRFLTLGPQEGAEAAPVTRDDIARVVAEWTGVPVARLAGDEQARLLGLEDALRRRVVGQDHAVAAVAEVVRTARAGLADSRRPPDAFLFTGPSGVGKTELAKALAELVFGDARHLLRFDMSEYMEEHAVSKLIGAPPGYVGHDEGGTLTNAVRRTPYAVVLLDEIEKAHRRVSDLLLQVLDEGRLTDAQGRSADFRNVIVVMTSNLGAAPRARAARKRLGFVAGAGADAEPSPAAPPAGDELREALLGHFRPELLGRIGRIVSFHSLERRHLEAIVEKILASLRARLAARDMTLRVAPEAIAALIEAGYRPDRGARELEAAIEQHVVQPLAKGVLEGRFTAGDTVLVVAGEKCVKLRRASTHDDRPRRVSAASRGLVEDAVIETVLRPREREDRRPGSEAETLGRDRESTSSS